MRDKPILTKGITMKLNKKTIAKRVVRFVVGSCVATTVTQVLANNTDPKSGLQYTEVLIGSVVVGAIAADVAGKYTDNVIDSFTKAYETSI